MIIIPDIVKKRGFVTLGVGIILILVSFVIAIDSLSDSDNMMFNEPYLPTLLEGVFDHVTQESVLYSGGSESFEYTVDAPNTPLMWGLQIIDFQDGDNIRIDVSNIFGDEFASVDVDESVVFEMFLVEKNDVYNFKVENTGDRTINVVMMFIEDPENSDALKDSDSPFLSLLLPLIISGILLIIGTVVMIVGVILFIMDWKKERKQPSNNNY